jgi:hypothetical protein
MCYIDGQKNKYSVINECNRMLKYNILTYKGSARVSVIVKCLVLVKIYGNSPRELLNKINENSERKIPWPESASELYLPSDSSSVVFTRLSGPRPRYTTSQKI